MPNVLTKLLKPSAFKMGLIVVAASVSWYWSFQTDKHPAFERLDNSIYDSMLRIRDGIRLSAGNPKPPTTGQVMIVDLDEPSLKAYGQWPWPRNLVAELLQKIYVDKPKVVGLDIVFAEKDRTSPRQTIPHLIKKIKNPATLADLKRLAADDENDHDYQLGEAIVESPTVLGCIFLDLNDGLKDAREPRPYYASIAIMTTPRVPQQLSPKHLGLATFYRAVMSVDNIRASDGEGFFNTFPSEDGIIRRVPLLVSMDGTAYPSLALEMLLIGLKLKWVKVIPSSNQVSVQDLASKNYRFAPNEKAPFAVKQGIEAILLAKDMKSSSPQDRLVSTDLRGQVVVNYRGNKQTFRYISAGAVLDGKTRGLFKDKYVLLGTSATGLLDLRSTPLGSAYPGVEVHANIIDNVLSGDSFQYDYLTERAITILFLLVGGISLVVTLAFTRPWIGGVIFVLYCLLVTVGNYYYFFILHRQIIGVSYPLASIIVVFLVVTLSNYLFEGRQRRYISEAFGRYISADLVEMLQKDPEKLSLTGEDKVMTVLFTDIRGFTSISERMSAQDLTLFLNEYLTPMTDIVMDTRGCVDKYMGDAIMAFWNAPLDDEDHVENACRCALRMLEVLAELQKEWATRGLPAIDIGIGVNTGRMSVGNMGSEKRQDYTVMGDAVNLGSRLEGLNKQYGTNTIISEYTRAALRDTFTSRLIDFVTVKGKKEPVKIYELVCEGELPAEKAAAIAEFQEALQLYYQRDFDKAEKILRGLQSHTPHILHEMYLERIAAYCDNPPADDWDGVWIHTSK